MKKLIAFMLILAFSVLVFAACGDEATTTLPASSSSQDVTTSGATVSDTTSFQSSVNDNTPSSTNDSSDTTSDTPVSSETPEPDDDDEGWGPLNPLDPIP